MTSPKLEAFEARAIAVTAQCDPRSVVRAVNGMPVRPMILARIKAALAAHGLAHLLPDAAANDQATPDPAARERR